MYDETTQFFPQFLIFKMADEVAHEDALSNRVLMDIIRRYQAIYDKSCRKYKDQRVKRNSRQAVANTLRIDAAQQRYNNIRTNFSKYIKSRRESLALEQMIWSYGQTMSIVAMKIFCVNIICRDL